jgi:hypothetical protein
MTVMNSELYRALIEAGVSDDAATKAAESVASYDQQFADVKLDLSDVKSDLRLLKWMLGALLAGVTALIVKAFFV